MWSKGEKIPINYFNRGTEEWIRMLSNGKKEESMTKKLDHNSKSICVTDIF